MITKQAPHFYPQSPTPLFGFQITGASETKNESDNAHGSFLKITLQEQPEANQMTTLLSNEQLFGFSDEEGKKRIRPGGTATMSIIQTPEANTYYMLSIRDSFPRFVSRSVINQVMEILGGVGQLKALATKMIQEGTTKNARAEKKRNYEGQTNSKAKKQGSGSQRERMLSTG